MRSYIASRRYDYFVLWTCDNRRIPIQSHPRAYTLPSLSGYSHVIENPQLAYSQFPTRTTQRQASCTKPGLRAHKTSRLPRAKPLHCYFWTSTLFESPTPIPLAQRTHLPDYRRDQFFEKTKWRTRTFGTVAHAHTARAAVNGKDGSWSLLFLSLRPGLDGLEEKKIEILSENVDKSEESKIKCRGGKWTWVYRSIGQRHNGISIPKQDIWRNHQAPRTMRKERNNEFLDHILTYFVLSAVSALTRPVSSASTDCWFAVRLVFNLTFRYISSPQLTHSLQNSASVKSPQTSASSSTDKSLAFYFSTFHQKTSKLKLQIWFSAEEKARMDWWIDGTCYPYHTPFFQEKENPFVCSNMRFPRMMDWWTDGKWKGMDGFDYDRKTIIFCLFTDFIDTMWIQNGIVLDLSLSRLL